VYNANRQIAASFGVALLATVLSNRLAHHGAALGDPLTRHGALLAFHEAFAAAAILASVGVVLAFWLIDDKEAAGTMRPAIKVPDAEIAILPEETAAAGT
jgi:hypothetical protein